MQLSFGPSCPGMVPPLHALLLRFVMGRPSSSSSFLTASLFFSISVGSSSVVVCAVVVCAAVGRCFHAHVTCSSGAVELCLELLRGHLVLLRNCIQLQCGRRGAPPAPEAGMLEHSLEEVTDLARGKLPQGLLSI